MDTGDGAVYMVMRNQEVHWIEEIVKKEGIKIAIKLFGREKVLK